MFISRKSNPLITGTLILTITGFASRFIGFFYRIFLSRLFGPEGMGIYQLISPVLALSFSLTVAGMQTAISKYVAGETISKDYRSSVLHLSAGFILSMLLSFMCTVGIYCYADEIALYFLMESRTAPLLRIIALSIPMATVHSCINGYFYGIRQTAVPALCQLSEQVVRVGSVYAIYYFCLKHNLTPTISFAVVGLVIGESASMLVSLIAVRAHFANVVPKNYGPLFSLDLPAFLTASKGLLMLAIPLSLNRVIINFLQSVEAIFIPNRLIHYGYDNATALSIYGVLTGMAMPLIFFPGAITNSICVLLLPIVSEAEASNNRNTIKKAVNKCIRYGFLLGILCTSVFLCTGKFLGNLLYQNTLAGSFIIILSFLCPLMYIASTLNSILNGLGKTGLTFVYSMLSLLVRLAFVFWGIPILGIHGYLWGILASQAVQTLLCMFAVRKYR
ncbi:putative polysaccharide biosynthesis protein [Parablautia muri]|uniref:Polysaccharide biosynthesis protein n=1 Tax=Parablautia muri TaxID=2320879 RepID=A0A9X5BED0_9FIRM|nr:polysaccharide biosynthesis protein [Parablautia muri]NBJ92189.1 polysaccharide biosynthesis protein [Parablautia muri]